MRNLALIFIVNALSVVSCKSPARQSDLSSQILSEVANVGERSQVVTQTSFCKSDFGESFYSKFLGAADAVKFGKPSPITFTYVLPYRTISKKISESVWQPQCSEVSSGEAAIKFIEKNRDHCRRYAVDYDSSVLFKDIWFEYRRKARQTQLVEEITRLCQITEAQYMAQIKKGLFIF